MKNRQIFTKLFFAITLVFAVNDITFGQCEIPIAPGQSYIEDFQSGEMECWTVETTSSATWAVMQGTGSNVVAFQNASAGQEARLVSPTFDLTGSSSATFSFAYAMMALYDNDELTVSYRTSPSDNWHTLATYSINDWVNTYDANTHFSAFVVRSACKCELNIVFVLASNLLAHNGDVSDLAT